MRRLSSHIILCLLAGFVFSCKPTVPGKYIQPDDFEDIMYDRYIAQAMAEDGKTGEEQAFNDRLYWLGVLKKHGVTEAEFDSSLVYYTRHADKMHKMYGHLAARLHDEAVALGASASELNKFTVSSVGDTANIWASERSIVLMQYPPYNTMSYSIQADTAFHKGDRLIFSFDTKFLFQDGYKNGVAMLAVQFGNDSIVSRTIHMSSDSHYSMDVMDSEKLGIKNVKGFITLSRGKEPLSTTQRLVFVDNIGLVRMHRKDAAAAEEKKDSTTVKDAKADSLKVDTLRKDVEPMPEKNARKEWENKGSEELPLTR